MSIDFHISPDAAEQPLLTPDMHYAIPSRLERNQSSLSFIEEDLQHHSVWKTVGLLLKSFIGTGVLFLPRSFYDAGIVPSILSMIFTACLSFYGVKILLKVTLVAPGTYWQIANEVGGPKMKQFVLVMLVLLQCGLVMAYTAFVAFNFTELLAKYASYTIDPVWFVLLVTLLMIPVCFTSKLKNFSTIASLGNLFIIITLLSVFYFACNEINTDPKPIHYFGDWKNTLKFMGTSVFAFEGIGLVVPLAQTLENSPSFTHIMYLTTIGILTMYLVLGLVTSIGFGESLQPIIFGNLLGQKIVACLVFFYSCSILATIPLTIFPVFEIVDEYVNKESRFKCISVKVVIMSVLCGSSYIFYSHLDTLVAILGSFCCIPLGIIIPGLLGYKLDKSKSSLIVVVLGCALVFMSLLVLLLE